jgi:hypothetical protein
MPGALRLALSAPFGSKKEKALSKKSVKIKPVAANAEAPAWRRVLLSLCLVPVVVGVLLIMAWALDWELWNGSLEAQRWVRVPAGWFQRSELPAK